MTNKILSYLNSNKFNRHLAYVVIGTVVLIIGLALLFCFALMLSFCVILEGGSGSFDVPFYISSFKFLGVVLLAELVVCGIKFIIFQIIGG